MIKRILVSIILFTAFTLAQSPVPPGAKLEKIASGFKFVEGPVWLDSLGLLFSDIEGNKIYRWNASDSSIQVFLDPSDSSNGLSLDNNGRLILTQMRLRRVSRMEDNRSITPLVTNYKGKKFNCPNDLAVKSDGSIFFTDPDFNVPYPGDKQLPYKGVYRLSASGTISLLDSSFDKPNGICFSPDEKKLYVNESPQGKIYAWDVVNDSTIANKKLLYSIPVKGYADGMKTDPEGNIYCTGPTGIWIVSPEGEYIDKILVPESARNCNWGDKDRKTLYITAGKSIYRIRLSAITGLNDQGYLPGFELYPNFPNPFNPSTSIRFSIAALEYTNMIVYDIQGNEIATLINEEKPPGEYEVVFNGSNLSSGTYFCCLKAGNYKETQKLVLLK